MWESYRKNGCLDHFLPETGKGLQRWRRKQRGVTSFRRTIFRRSGHWPMRRRPGPLAWVMELGRSSWNVVKWLFLGVISEGRFQLLCLGDALSTLREDACLCVHLDGLNVKFPSQAHKVPLERQIWGLERWFSRESTCHMSHGHEDLNLNFQNLHQKARHLNPRAREVETGRSLGPAGKPV